MWNIVMDNNVTKDVINILCDSDNRVIDHLRLSVTENCNLACCYCAPEKSSGKQELSVAEIAKLAQLLHYVGIKSLRITGGEPLLRKDVVEIAACIAAIGFADISLTTNATLLTTASARALAAAGVSRLNIGIPSINSTRYKTITGANLALAIAGTSCATGQFDDVRINVVMVEGFDIQEFETVREFANSFGITPRFIEYMPAFGAANTAKFDISQWLLTLGARKIQPLFGQGPAEYFSVPGFVKPVGLIMPLHNKFCSSCRRIRLSSSGELRRCLFDNQLLNLINLLATNSQMEVMASIKSFIKGKPTEHSIDYTTKLGQSMAKIGG